MEILENFTTDVSVDKEELINFGSHLLPDPDIFKGFFNTAR